MIKMIEHLKKATEIKVHLESGKGYFVVDCNLTMFSLEDLDIEDTKYIIENGEQVAYEHNITSHYGDIFEYTIHNGGEYEFAEWKSIYSYKFINEKRFNEMIKEAINSINSDSDYEKRNAYNVARKVKELYPNIFIEIGLGTGACTNEWNNEE